MYVSAIVPAFNEEGWVGKTVETLLKLPEIGEVIVVDDGSTDKTAQEALEAGATVFSFSTNRGKSQALREGVRFSKGKILAFVDADLRESALEIRKLIHVVAKDEADMSIACFKAPRRAGLGFVRTLAYWAIRLRSGERMAVPLSGQRVLKRSLWEALSFKAEGFAAEVALTIESSRSGYRIKEIPLQITHRFTGNDLYSFCHRGRQFLAVLKYIMKGQ
ncbi:MAG: glycosyltransferase family 2 protein [Dethiobacteria bacterium]|jgi:glycosyltransferase involved in cell wall biosynthesis